MFVKNILWFKTILIVLLSVNAVYGAIGDKDNDYIETSTGKFQIECIKVHNYYRRLHGAVPLKHSAKLEDFARYRAVEIAKKDGTNFFHPDDLVYGENLAWNSIEDVACKIPLKLWYDEWKIYNFNKPNITSKNGHFTQVVWKDTRKVGCGQAISKGKVGGTYTVCNYDPPGNYINEELDNVKPALKKKKYRPTPKPGNKPNSKPKNKNWKPKRKNQSKNQRNN